MINGSTLLELRTRAKRRADMENSSFVADAEWDDYLNEEGAELHDLLVSKFGDDYYLTSKSISVTAGTDTYALPEDFLKCRGVDYVSGSDSYSLRRFTFEERNERRLYSGDSVSSAEDLSYRIQADDLVLSPAPGQSTTLTLWYVPGYVKLVADADKVSGIIAAGWESYMVIGAAMKALAKEESDTSHMAAEKAAIVARVEAAASNRDIGAPFVPQNMRSIDDLGVW